MLACSKHEVSLFLAHPWASLKASASVLHEANKHRAHSACAGTFICRARLGHLLLGAFPMETHAGKTVLGKGPGGCKESRSLPCTVILHVMTEFQITQFDVNLCMSPLYGHSSKNTVFTIFSLYWCIIREEEVLGETGVNRSFTNNSLPCVTGLQARAFPPVCL